MKEFFIVIALIGFAVFLILLVLVQRGRGGGLAGALGGAGGQSAFGAKAGDTFTKITMWTAFFWIVFCVIAVRLMTGSGEPDFSSTLGGAAQTEPVQERAARTKARKPRKHCPLPPAVAVKNNLI